MYGIDTIDTDDTVDTDDSDNLIYFDSEQAIICQGFQIDGIEHPCGMMITNVGYGCAECDFEASNHDHADCSYCESHDEDD